MLVLLKLLEAVGLVDDEVGVLEGGEGEFDDEGRGAGFAYALD